MVLLGCTAVFNLGCRHQVMAERRLAERERSMDFAVDAVADREAENPGRLRADFKFIGNEIERDARRTADNMDKIGEYLQRDLERWNERQDDYLREAGRILRGNPENIEPAAIILFM
jgi:hypothetical protein